MEERKSNSRYGANLKIGGRLYTPAQVGSMRDYIQAIEKNLDVEQAPVNNTGMAFNAVSEEKSIKKEKTADLKTESAPTNEEKKPSDLHRDRLLNDQAVILRKPYHAARTVVRDRYLT